MAAVARRSGDEMTMDRVLYQIDAFTDRLFGGNPAGVVPYADGMTAAQMQALARELNNSETAFISRDASPDYDLHIRYFTPTAEVPVCGHATIASGHALLAEGWTAPQTVRIRTGAGILAIELHPASAGFRISMRQGAIVLGAPLADALVQRIVAALGLQAADLDTRCPIQVASTGHGKLMIALRRKACLDSLTPNHDALKMLSAEIGCNGYYLFTFDAGEPGVLVAGRMFAPAIGIAEDPVTGNANGPLGAYLAAHRLVPLPERTLTFVAKQGEAIGRTGYVGVAVALDQHGAPQSVTISGNAVTVFRTTIALDTPPQQDPQ